MILERDSPIVQVTDMEATLREFERTLLITDLADAAVCALFIVEVRVSKISSRMGRCLCILGTGNEAEKRRAQAPWHVYRKCCVCRMSPYVLDK